MFELGRTYLARGPMASHSIRHARHSTCSSDIGSKWCAWNAIVEHHDHHGRVRSPEGAFVPKIEDPTGIKRRALELVTAA